MSSNLTAGAIGDDTKSVDTSLRLPRAVVKASHQFLQCCSVSAKYPQSPFQSQSVE